VRGRRRKSSARGLSRLLLGEGLFQRFAYPGILFFGEPLFDGTLRRLAAHPAQGSSDGQADLGVGIGECQVQRGAHVVAASQREHGGGLRPVARLLVRVFENRHEPCRGLRSVELTQGGNGPCALLGGLRGIIGDLLESAKSIRPERLPVLRRGAALEPPGNLGNKLGLGPGGAALGRRGVFGREAWCRDAACGGMDEKNSGEGKDAGLIHESRSLPSVGGGASPHLSLGRVCPLLPDMSGRVVVFVSAGSYEPAFQVASLAITAAAMGDEVHVVFAFDALRDLHHGTFGHPRGEQERAESARAEGLGVPAPFQMLEEARLLGARLLACDTTVKLCGLSVAEVAGQIDEVMGLASVWRLTQGARTLSF